MAGPRQSTGGKAGASLKGARILVVEARYYEEIADALLSGVISALDDAATRQRHYQEVLDRSIAAAEAAGARFSTGSLCGEGAG